MNKYNLPDRFWNKVDIRHEDECWEWTATKTYKNYGIFYFKEKYRRAHRVCAEAKYGNIDNVVVRHKCDNPICVNPNHLEVGTQKDNVQDMVSRGRARHGVSLGESHGLSKLTEQQVLEIYNSTEYQRVLAEKYNVGTTTISEIRRGLRWTHITGHKK